ncbi:MAG TPA: S-layer homology domain-containing protein, partial [Patescibacteria group bacterium]|nr:S-layer homology domain-containing protein [Patescibacteria group bacterium]
MRRSISKIISLVICIILVLPMSVFAQQTADDYSNHWAGVQIKSFLEKGFVSANKDGSFKPNNPITRAEFAVIANKVFGLTLTDKVNFKDVKLKDVFYKDMSIARKAGYFTPLPGGNIMPNTNMSRQEFAVVLARLLKIDIKKEIPNKVIFKDNDKIAVWSRNSIDAVVQRGYMSGNTDGTFSPAGLITRAQAVTVLEICLRDNIITAYGNLKVAYKKAGTYIPKIINGNVAIEVPNVNIENTIIYGNLIIGEGVGNGNVKLKNVTVTGNTV